jgi:Flp pilus assembly protein TadB
MNENEKTPVKGVQMDRMDRGENGDAAQKAKVIFLALAAAVVILLVFSFVYASKAKSELKTVKQELELLKTDNAKLSQWLEERTQEVEKLKFALEQSKTKAKIKAATKGKTTPKSATKKKATKSSKASKGR